VPRKLMAHKTLRNRARSASKALTLMQIQGHQSIPMLAALVCSIAMRKERSWWTRNGLEVFSVWIIIALFAARILH
jgi:hypothetical protein